MSWPNLARAPRFISGKTRLASRSNRLLAGGNQRITVLNVVPNPRDRESKERHRTAVSADHKGKYLALCKTDFNDVKSIVLYDWIQQQYQSKTIGASLRVHVHCSLFEGVLTGPAALRRNPKNVAVAVFSLLRPLFSWHVGVAAKVPCCSR